MGLFVGLYLTTHYLSHIDPFELDLSYMESLCTLSLILLAARIPSDRVTELLSTGIRTTTLKKVILTLAVLDGMDPQSWDYSSLLKVFCDDRHPLRDAILCINLVAGPGVASIQESQMIIQDSLSALHAEQRLKISETFDANPWPSYERN